VYLQFCRVLYLPRNNFRLQFGSINIRGVAGFRCYLYELREWQLCSPCSDHPIQSECFFLGLCPSTTFFSFFLFLIKIETSEHIYSLELCFRLTKGQSRSKPESFVTTSNCRPSRDDRPSSMNITGAKSRKFCDHLQLSAVATTVCETI
jgi:hypothetical protein